MKPASAIRNTPPDRQDAAMVKREFLTNEGKPRNREERRALKRIEKQQRRKH